MKEEHGLILASFALLIVVCCMLVGGIPALAVTDTTLGAQLQAQIDPPNPGPGETATITLQSFALNLPNATISWLVNGKQVRKGLGETKIPVTMGPAGTRTSVRITVSVPGSEVGSQKTLVFVPQELSLTWEADSYVPPLYKGKALPAPGGVVRLIAQPQFRNENGQAIAPENLMYRWKKAGEDIPQGNGKGIQTIRTTINNLGKTKFSVEVSSPDGVLRATEILEIEPSNPRIIFYEDRALHGTAYAVPVRASLFLENTETTLRAEPYFFSLPLEALEFSWFVNGNKTSPDSQNPQLITLRHEGQTRSSAQIQASILSSTFLFQEAKSGFTAQFGQ